MLGVEEKEELKVIRSIVAERERERSEGVKKERKEEKRDVGRVSCPGVLIVCYYCSCCTVVGTCFLIVCWLFFLSFLAAAVPSLCPVTASNRWWVVVGS